MTNKSPKPWHEIVRLKKELQSGELALAEFAADLHEVTLHQGKRPVYEQPDKFFALTYPTHALRELVKDVALRLAGKNDKAVQQLALTYGGGKTHTLITLYHLFQNPSALPDLPAVREFREHAGGELPNAFSVTLCFDKIDVEKGIEGVRAPDGETRTLRHPWSILAFQLAGAEGLRAIHGDGKDEERETPPAEPLLVKLLERPQKDGRATLILVDEVLMYAREKAGQGQVWRERIQDFFQHLVQTVIKVDRAAMVASLLATDPQRQQDEIGQRMSADLFDVFRRQQEKGVQPVEQKDVAEVLRRRFFEPLPDQDKFRAHVIAVVRGIIRLDGTTRQNRADAENRFLESFPFHPDLTDVFYSRWTQLKGFQRTRGILRILTTALREAKQWDRSPVIGPAVLLSAPEEKGVSEAVRELAGIAASEGEGRGDWATLIESELDKARQIQTEFSAFTETREVEQAVIAVFLHSQPIGHKAHTPELMRMIGSASPDSIELQKSLQRWREVSWFLDDEDLGREGTSPGSALPMSWRLGNRPNLRQMHDEACKGVTGEMVEARLESEIRNARNLLTADARTTGAEVHLLPSLPKDVGDDGKFRYVVLGPKAVSESGKPSAEAKRFLNETSAADRPRVHRNAVVIAVPSRDGLDAARSSIRSLLGWEEVQKRLSSHQVDPIRMGHLSRRLTEAGKQLPGTIRHSYSIVVTMSEHSEVQAFRLRAESEALFTAIKNDDRTRIKETAIDAEALLPGGPYDLWREDEEVRLVKNLTSAFARYPRLPKMIRSGIILDTILQGIQRGLFVARLSRPDHSVRTWWREEVDQEVRQDPALEIALPNQAELHHLSAHLLAPEILPELWADEQVSLRKVIDYFSGGRTVQQPEHGNEEMLVIPRCPEDVISNAVRQAVEEGIVWLTNGPTSLCKEPIPPGVLDDNAVLHPKPEPIPPQKLRSASLPGAWQDNETNGIKLMQALSREAGRPLPWGVVRDSIQTATVSRWLELREGSVSVGDCDYDNAGNLLLKIPQQLDDSAPLPQVSGAALEGPQIQDLAEKVSEIAKLSAGYELRFHVDVTLKGKASEQTRAKLDELLAMVSPDLKAKLLPDTKNAGGSTNGTKE